MGTEVGRDFVENTEAVAIDWTITVKFTIHEGFFLIFYSLFFFQTWFSADNAKITSNASNVTRLTNAKQAFVTYLASLVERTLVMEKQPPQVLMKDKRFVATLRHLVGDKLDIHKVAFQVQKVENE